MPGILLLIAIVAAFLFWFVGAYNGLIGLKNQTLNAWKQIDVQLKRRHDLIPNLVETVKGAMSFERRRLFRLRGAGRRLAPARPAHRRRR